MDAPLLVSIGRAIMESLEGDMRRDSYQVDNLSGSNMDAPLLASMLLYVPFLFLLMWYQQTCKIHVIECPWGPPATVNNS